MQQFFVWIGTRTDGLNVDAHSPIHAATRYLEIKDTTVPMKYSFAFKGGNVPVSVETHNGETYTVVIKPRLNATYEWQGKFVRTFENGFNFEPCPIEQGESHGKRQDE